MSLYGYQPKTRPALWKQAQDEAGVVDHLAIARQQYKTAKAERKKREADLARWKRPPKQRQRVNQVSANARQRLEEYRKARASYLRDCPFCEVCVQIDQLTGGDGTGKKREHEATDIHHVRGRAGPLLTDRRFFKAACRNAHDWIHANPSLARAINLLAQPGQWNRPDL